MSRASDLTSLSSRLFPFFSPLEAQGEHLLLSLKPPSHLPSERRQSDFADEPFVRRAATIANQQLLVNQALQTLGDDILHVLVLWLMGLIKVKL